MESINATLVVSYRIKVVLPSIEWFITSYELSDTLLPNILQKLRDETPYILFRRREGLLVNNLGRTVYFTVNRYLTFIFRA